MNSLEELNAWGNTPVDYLDARPSSVIFNRVYPQNPVDQTFDAYASFTVEPTPGIEIVEIVNYQTANVRYRVTVKTGSTPLFTGSTITFGTFNSGVTLSQVGDVYTVSGIHSVSDWDSVKNFTWTLPVDFASYPQWYLECTIIYYSSALATDVETTWEIVDDAFYNVAALEVVSSIVAIGGKSSPASVAMSSTATFYANPWNQLYGAAALTSAATFTCDGFVNVTYLNSISTMTVNARKTAVGVSDMSSIGSMTTNAVASAINLDSRTYLANVGNAIFSTNTPQVDSLNSADTFSIVLSSALGYFAANSTAAPTSTVTISGSEAVVNAAFVNVHFYPTKGSSTSGTFTWAQSRNGTLEFSRNITLTGIANAFAEVTTTYTSNSTFIPTGSQCYYGLFDILLAGAGGSGGTFILGTPIQYAGGGGGGGVIQLTNQSISYGSYSITVGQGQLNANGGDTIAFGQTAYGGFMGPMTMPTRWGGNSGAPTTYYGASEYGGGGGGAGASATNEQGGSGVTSAITGLMYGSGGGGGADFSGEAKGFGASGAGNGGTYQNNQTNLGGPFGTSNATAGIDGRGGGGGGGSYDDNANPTPGKRGGHGTVIIKIHA